jgi:hypothetical protein
MREGTGFVLTLAGVGGCVATLAATGHLPPSAYAVAVLCGIAALFVSASP